MLTTYFCKNTLIFGLNVLQNPLVKRVAEIFDGDLNGEVDFKEFVLGLAEFTLQVTGFLFVCLVSYQEGTGSVDLIQAAE